MPPVSTAPRLQAHVVLSVVLIAALIALIVHGGLPTKPEADRFQRGVSSFTLEPVESTEPDPPRTDDIWRLDDVGLQLPIPPGWSEVEVKGNRYLRRVCEAPLEGNFNVIRLPNLFHRDIDGLLAENLEELTENPSFALDSARKLRIGTRDALRMDYRGTPRGAPEELHFAGVIFLQGSWQIVLTACARQSVWHEIEPWVESSLASLQITAARESRRD